MSNNITETRKVKDLIPQLSREAYTAYEEFKDKLRDGILHGESKLPSPNQYLYLLTEDTVVIYSVSNRRFNRKGEMEEEIRIDSLKPIESMVNVNSGWTLQNLASGTKQFFDRVQFYQFLLQLLPFLLALGLALSQLKPSSSSPKLENYQPTNSQQNQKQ